MHSAQEKLSNAASAVKEHVDIYKAKIEEKVVSLFKLFFNNSKIQYSAQEINRD